MMFPFGCGFWFGVWGRKANSPADEAGLVEREAAIWCRLKAATGRRTRESDVLQSLVYITQMKPIAE